MHQQQRMDIENINLENAIAQTVHGKKNVQQQQPK